MASRIRIDITDALLKKQIKERRQISLAEVAEVIGEHRQTIYNWRDEKISQASLDVLAKLCDYFDCEVGDLLVRERNGVRQVAP